MNQTPDLSPASHRSQFASNLLSAAWHDVVDHRDQPAAATMLDWTLCGQDHDQPMPQQLDAVAEATGAPVPRGATANMAQLREHLRRWAERKFAAGEETAERELEGLGETDLWNEYFVAERALRHATGEQRNFVRSRLDALAEEIAHRPAWSV